jgi:hypothetical protein
LRIILKNYVEESHINARDAMGRDRVGFGGRAVERHSRHPSYRSAAAKAATGTGWQVALIALLKSTETPVVEAPAPVR